MKRAAETSKKKELYLITRTAAGDEIAFEALYSMFYKRLFRFIYHTTGRFDLVEAVINDVMYTVWEKAATYNQTCRLSTWILGIAYNKSLQHIDLQKSKLDCEAIDEVDEHLLPRGADWVERLETENWLENAFEVLSVEQRVVVELTYYNGLSYQEIAKLMKCPENTVKSRMLHARKKLASTLETNTLYMVSPGTVRDD